MRVQISATRQFLCEALNYNFFSVNNFTRKTRKRTFLLPSNHKVYVVTANCYDYDDSRKKFSLVPLRQKSRKVNGKNVCYKCHVLQQ